MKKNNLFKTFIGFAIGPLGAALINFLTIPMITWIISPDEFGKTSLFLLMQTLAASFIFLGMDHSFVREYNNHSNKKELLLNALFFPFFLSMLFCLLLIIFAINLESFFNEESSIVILCFAIWLPFVTIERFLLLNIRMEEKGFLYSLFNILTKFTIMLLTLVFLIFIAESYLMVIVASVIGQIIIDIVLIAYCKKSIEFRIKNISKASLKKMFKFGYPFIPTALIMWLLNSTDRLFLERFTSYENLGIYFAALKIIGVLTIFQNIFATFWLPVAYKWRKENVSNHEFDKVSKIIALIMSIVFILVLLFKEVLVSILSEEYSKALIIIPFLLLYPIMYTMSETTSLGISFFRKTKYNIWISAFLVLINITLNWFLIPLFNILGASIALGVTYVLYFWVRTLVSRKLWFEFELRYYIMITIMLVIIASGNVVLNEKATVFNLFFLLLICVYNYKIFIAFLTKLKLRLIKV
ncbi:oligosaccharide flippase family protein [Metabacillus indicus]|uniref:lipopolysaccharide biosynthesis protein n=1 Tax=Metabacillus indicus TaxID=246786 RepID=UPI00316F8F08